MCEKPGIKSNIQSDFELRNGRTVSLDVSSPQALLYVSASRKMFSNQLMRVYDKHPCGPTRPWRLCIYCDEAKPGNVMKQDNARVLQHVYAGTMDFGAAALAEEVFWFVSGNPTSKNMAALEGGM